MIEFGTAHEVLFCFHAAAGIRGSSAPGKFRWIARRPRHRGCRAISRRTEKPSRCDSWERSETGSSNHEPKNPQHDHVEYSASLGEHATSAVRRISRRNGRRRGWCIRSTPRSPRNSSLAPLPYASGKLPPEKPSRETFDGDLKWLAAHRPEERSPIRFASFLRRS